MCWRARRGSVEVELEAALGEDELNCCCTCWPLVVKGCMGLGANDWPAGVKPRPRELKDAALVLLPLLKLP